MQAEDVEVWTPGGRPSVQTQQPARRCSLSRPLTLRPSSSRRYVSALLYAVGCRGGHRVSASYWQASGWVVGAGAVGGWEAGRHPRRQPHLQLAHLPPQILLGVEWSGVGWGGRGGVGRGGRGGAGPGAGVCGRVVGEPRAVQMGLSGSARLAHERLLRAAYPPPVAEQHCAHQAALPGLRLRSQLLLQVRHLRLQLRALSLRWEGACQGSVRVVSWGGGACQPRVTAPQSPPPRPRPAPPPPLPPPARRHACPAAPLQVPGGWAVPWTAAARRPPLP